LPDKTFESYECELPVIGIGAFSKEGFFPFLVLLILVERGLGDRGFESPRQRPLAEDLLPFDRGMVSCRLFEELVIFLGIEPHGCWQLPVPDLPGPPMGIAEFGCGVDGLALVPDGHIDSTLGVHDDHGAVKTA
jgi:hypothetical protein